METPKQLNPFEIKTEINNFISEFKNICDVQNHFETIKLLDAQQDKKTIVKILYKELYNLKDDNGTIICFLLERYSEKEELTKKLWELLKNNLTPNNVRIIIVNFLRGLDSNWEIDSGDELLDAEIIDAETKNLLNNAIINPEIQIDFLDFLNSLSQNDKITLINSMGNDYTNDELANILIPVFLSQPDSTVGQEALRLLGESKSQLAFHALNTSMDYVSDSILPLVKKNLSTLKIAGIREDNSEEFYKKILADSVPYKCCATYPDGYGNQALIFSRQTKKTNRIQFVAVVIDDYHGIRDCFGFNDISQFECDKIIERFYKNEKEIYISIEQLKSILQYAESITKKNNSNWLMPYEYICWKNLLRDVKVSPLTKSLSDNLKSPSKLNKKELENTLNLDCTSKWFFDENYNDETRNFLMNGSKDFNKLIEDNYSNIFTDSEINIWLDRILITSFVKFIKEDINDAQLLYNLYFDKKIHKAFFTCVLQRSIYEYYTKMKFNTELNNGQYSIKELDEIINQIEDLWVYTE